MDTSSIRRANLQRLIRAEGSLKKFAERIDSAESYISSIVSTNAQRNAGARLMRRVEKAYHLEPGSLDFPDVEAMTAAIAIQALDEREQRQIFDFLAYKLQGSGRSAELQLLLRALRKRANGG